MPHPFPHLMPAEAIIWTRFMAQHGHEWDRWDYDVRVGEGRPVDPSWPREIQDMARHLTRKRIDAIGWRGNSPTIFEVTPRAGRATLGAIWMYAELFDREHPEHPVATTAVVTVRIDPDVLATFERDGTAVYLLEPAPGE